MSHGKRLNLKDKIFGQLTAIEPLDKRRYGYVVWACSCSCGGSIKVPACWLNCGRTTHCGCRTKEKMYVAVRARTTCKRGHPYEDGYRFKQSSGQGSYRRCRICSNAANRIKRRQERGVDTPTTVEEILLEELAAGFVTRSKTTCQRGHPYTGGRCRICRNAWRRGQCALKKAKGLEASVTNLRKECSTSYQEWNKVLQEMGLGMGVGSSRLWYCGDIYDARFLSKPLW
jgi:hypothetical protein